MTPLTRIRILHTSIWAVIAGAILALPEFIAAHNKQIFTILFVAGDSFALWRWFD